MNKINNNSYASGKNVCSLMGFHRFFLRPSFGRRNLSRFPSKSTPLTGPQGDITGLKIPSMLTSEPRSSFLTSKLPHLLGLKPDFP